MKPSPELEELEHTVGAQLRRAMPPVQAPPVAVERMRRRLNTAPARAATGQGEPAQVVQFPRRPASRRPWRWVAVAAVAALLLTAGSPQAGRLGRRWFGPRTSFPISAPFSLAATAAAAAPAGATLPQRGTDVRYQLEASFPDLPGIAPVWRVRFASDPAWLEETRKRLGIAERVEAQWDKVPHLSPLRGHQAGPLSLSATGGWSYYPGVPSGTVPAVSSPAPAPTAQPPGPPVSDEEARQSAERWLKQAGLYPAESVETHVQRIPRAPDVATVRMYPAAGSPFAAAGDVPSIGLTVRAGRVEMASGLWPAAVEEAGAVPLRTAQEAWADLQAGIGVVSPWRREGIFDGADNPVVTVRDVRLGRALVRSLDDRWYFTPVVVFRGDTVDRSGQVRAVMAYVSAVKPTPGQAGYELKADLPTAPASVPPIRVKSAGSSIRTSKAGDPVETFAVPIPANVRGAALRVAAAAGLPAEQLGEPQLYWNPTGVMALVPVKAAGLPLVQTVGDPSWPAAVDVSFSLTGGVESVVVLSLPAEAAGDPLPVLTAAEAWHQVQGGAGAVKVIHHGDDYPNAHFAAHRTVITRVELAYNLDQAAHSGQRPAEPAYFFWGTAEVGEAHREVPVVVILPAWR